jgi:hypothetical protein
MPMCAMTRAASSAGTSSVHDVQPRDGRVTRELAAEHEELEVGADHRDRPHHPVGDPQAGARQEIVRQRVAGEALQEGQHQQGEPDEPADLPRSAVGAGEEVPECVDHDGGDEDQRGPVMDLPDQQTTPHLEADAQR